MDPLSAIGLASNILSFVDFGIEVVTRGLEIYKSSSGSTEVNRSTKDTVTELRRFMSKLQRPDDAQLTGDEKSLCMLAKECDDTAKQIIALVEKVQLKGPKSKTASVLAGIKTMWYEKDCRELKERLGRYQTQLGLQLDYLTSSEVQSRVDRLIISAKDDSSKLEQLSSQIEYLRKGVAVSSLSDKALIQLKSLLAIPEHAGDVITQQRILANLSFQGMYQRYETIPDAHSKTLQWIFGEELRSESRSSSNNESDDEVDNQSQSGVETRADSAGTSEGINDVPDEADGGVVPNYDIHYRDESLSYSSDLSAAKLDEEKTAAKRALLPWLSSGNDPHNLIFASFFFWKPGSTLQKSLTGLIRSLLHDVLQASPELIPDVLPDYWQRVKSTPWQAMSQIRLSDRDIRKAFDRLISDANLYKDHCFCFFIDGLDEYEGTVQDDTKSLVELLRSWTLITPNHVKLCVSSREYNVFMNAFPADRRIRVHEITRQDMRQYVLSKLGFMENERNQEVLTNTIVDNAQGIFLWVALVVKRIREQIENERNFDDLKREINALPKEMDGLFAHLLESLPDSDLREAYEIFSILIEIGTIKRPGFELSILSYSFLDDYKGKRSFVLENDFVHVQLNAGDLAARTQSALKRLNGCCKGFVETVSQEGSTSLYPIRFTHRSVQEFLSTEARKNEMQRLLRGFNAIDAFSHLVLAENLADPQSMEQYCVIDVLVSLRAQENLDQAPYLFLETLCSLVTQFRNLTSLSSVPDDSERLADSEPAEDLELRSASLNLIEDHEWYLVPIAHCPGSDWLRTSAADHPAHPIYQAALAGNHDYVRWKLTHDFAAVSQLSMEILLNCIMRSNKRVDITDVLSTIEVLISQGLGPQKLTNISHLAFYAFDRQNPKTQMSLDMTVWQHLLLTCYGCTVWNLGAKKAWNLLDKLPKFGYVVEKFLEHGADPNFQFGIREIDDDWILKLVVGKENRELLLKYSYLYWSLTPYACEAASLTDFIKLFDFENEDRILKLIERNIRMFGGTGDNDIAQDKPEGPAVSTDVEAPQQVPGDAKKDANEETLEKAASTYVMGEKRSLFPIISLRIPIFVLASALIIAMVVQWIRIMAVD